MHLSNKMKQSTVKKNKKKNIFIASTLLFCTDFNIYNCDPANK